MRITPAELIPDPLELAETLPVGGVEFAPDVTQAGPLRVTGRAERIEEHLGPKQVIEDIRLRARIAGEFQLLCARCVEPVAHTVDETVDLIFRPAGTDAQSGERAITEAETEIGYYEQSGLLLEDAVREQVLLSLPERTLCQPNCKGLCAHCGGNLNEVSCDCAREAVDPRWSALKGLRSLAEPAER